jgi:hypothetical protein
MIGAEGGRGFSRGIYASGFMRQGFKDLCVRRDWRIMRQDLCVGIYASGRCEIFVISVIRRKRDMVQAQRPAMHELWCRVRILRMWRGIELFCTGLGA